MRRLAAALWAVFLVLPVCVSAQTKGVVMTAQQIALYADRGLLVAQGGVAVRSPAFAITGTSAAYDLRANTLTVVTDTGGYVYDFTNKTGTPVRSASVSQFNTVDALAIAQQVEIAPAAAIVFSNAQVRSGTALVPAASYTYAIPRADAKNFGYSPVPSAALEWPFVVSSGSDGYTFARARYDKYNGGPGTGMEEHFAASARGYAVLAQTLDVDGGRFDMAAYQQINDALSQTLTGSTLAGSRALRYALSSSTRRGFAQLSFSQNNASRNDDLLLTGNQRPVAGLGSSRLQIDFGHDVHPADWRVAQDFRVTPSVHFDTATVHAGRSSFSGSFDLGESLYDYGRASLASAAGLWSTIPVNAHVELTGGMNFYHSAPPFPATLRTYTAGMTWRASDAFNLVSSLTYAHDYGQAFGLGRPQFSAAFDVRFRRRNGTGLEIGSIVPFGGVGDRNRQTVFNVRFLR
ncbi:MAG TPA: hypothetical protein VJP85_03615 [Candidatus Baltobacteraceae bacterium]|nr:hypothetical protein [Candidatus Baltobacteraceae bacterium]